MHTTFQGKKNAQNVEKSSVLLIKLTLLLLFLDEADAGESGEPKVNELSFCCCCC